MSVISLSIYIFRQAFSSSVCPSVDSDAWFDLPLFHCGRLQKGNKNKYNKLANLLPMGLRLRSRRGCLKTVFRLT